MDWVKIMCNILDHRKIKMIRKGPEGNTLVLLWLIMLTEAGKCNRGGYLMISDNLPYSAQTLSMVTDIPLPTIQLGLATFTSLDMIDQLDGAIFIKNWGKYQSVDKLEKRLQADRERQQRHRQNEKARQKLLPENIPEQFDLSRDSHACMSRDVTQENRTEQKREEKTTTEVRLLLSGTPFSELSDSELQALTQRHGIERLFLAADIAAQTWQRGREDILNPGGYLNSLCSSLLMPDWYVPFAERMTLSQASQERKAAADAVDATLKAQEEEQALARNNLWESLAEEQREDYRSAVVAGLPEGLAPSMAVTAMAKILAWDAKKPSNHD